MYLICNINNNNIYWSYFSIVLTEHPIHNTECKKVLHPNNVFLILFIYLFILQRALRCIFFTNEKQPNSFNPKTTAKVLDGMVIQANQKLSTRIK